MQPDHADRSNTRLASDLPDLKIFAETKKHELGATAYRDQFEANPTLRNNAEVRQIDSNSVQELTVQDSSGRVTTITRDGDRFKIETEGFSKPTYCRAEDLDIWEYPAGEGIALRANRPYQEGWFASEQGLQKRAVGSWLAEDLKVRKSVTRHENK